ncbi:MAG: VOC family protein [Tolypothrix brevis GSE-NOS-MK-07-07A]|jgi:hypothetical protein|nr:VOC family protein [Tolypothrix brevis GSE-NOS-MK-07-07A]
MGLELDHIFVCVEPKAPEAEFLKGFGFQEGNRRTHQGQGTANVCFLFHNAYLELLWLSDINEILSSVVRPLGLWERCCWRETEACPFGISLRSDVPDSLELPFATWNYYAPYLPAGASIPIAANSENLSEPLIFISPVSRIPSASPLKRGLLVNKPGFDEITKLRVTLVGEKNFSAELRKLAELGLVELKRGDRYHLEIEFNQAQEGQIQLFDSTLPISFRW